MAAGRPKLAVRRLELLEQAHILDGDGGLVGKGLEKFQMCVGEGVDFAVGKADGTDDFVLPKHRNGHHTSGAPRPKVRERVWSQPGLFGSGLEVSDPDRTSSADCLAGHAGGRHGLGPRRPPLLELVRRVTVVCHGMDKNPIKAIHASL